ncbi:MAG: hypothetical protein U0269_19530 [Polyangiales bacterium]
MSLSRTVVAALALSLVACGSPTPGNDAGNDSSTTQDSGMMMANDSGMMMSGDASMSGDSGGSGGGTCGAATIQCMCACGMGAGAAACQNQCVNSNMACGQCVVQAQLSCCPAQAQALSQCAMAAQMASDAGPACTDQACVTQRCSMEVQAFQSCFAMAQQNDMACRSALGTCFGTFPFTCN